MIWAFDSPGSVSAVLIIALRTRDSTAARVADTGRDERRCAARLVYALGRSELVGCGVRIGHRVSAISHNVKSASSMPMRNRE
jgi:hypothetical protein